MLSPSARVTSSHTVSIQILHGFIECYTSDTNQRPVRLAPYLEFGNSWLPKTLQQSRGEVLLQPDVLNSRSGTYLVDKTNSTILLVFSAVQIRFTGD